MQKFLQICWALYIASLRFVLLQQQSTKQTTLLITYRFKWAQSVNNTSLLPAHAQHSSLHGNAADMLVNRGKSKSARADLSKPQLRSLDECKKAHTKSFASSYNNQYDQGRKESKRKKRNKKKKSFWFRELNLIARSVFLKRESKHTIRSIRTAVFISFVTPTPLRITVYFLSHFCSFFLLLKLSFLLSLYI